MAKQNQHYVPQFLLRNFVDPKKGKLFVYDKSNDDKYHASAKNIASESGFYDFQLGDEQVSLEPALGILESSTAPIINKILKARSLRILDDEDKTTLSTFMALQFVRTKHQREKLGQLSTEIRDVSEALGASIEELDRLNVHTDSEAIKASSVLAIAEFVRAFVPHFLNKGWALYETEMTDPLYLSDNPIVLDNQQTFGPYGNLGLAVPGIEIYFPLSSTLCLYLVCPTIDKEFREELKNIEQMDQSELEFFDAKIANGASTSELIRAYVEGYSIRMGSEGVERANSLQVINSTRFVFCQEDKFDLVRDMISNNENFRSGKKPKFG